MAILVDMPSLRPVLRISFLNAILWTLLALAASASARCLEHRITTKVSICLDRGYDSFPSSVAGRLGERLKDSLRRDGYEHPAAMSVTSIFTRKDTGIAIGTSVALIGQGDLERIYFDPKRKRQFESEQLREARRASAFGLVPIDTSSCRVRLGKERSLYYIESSHIKSNEDTLKLVERIEFPYDGTDILVSRASLLRSVRSSRGDLVRLFRLLPAKDTLDTLKATVSLLVEQMQQDLPTMVDKNTRLDGVSLLGKQINFFYTLVDVGLGEARTFMGELHGEMAKAWCQNPSAMNVMDHGYSYVHEISLENGLRLGKSELRREDCGSLPVPASATPKSSSRI